LILNSIVGKFKNLQTTQDNLLPLAKVLLEEEIEMEAAVKKPSVVLLKPFSYSAITS